MVLKNKAAYPLICFEIMADLKENLPAHLDYHSLEHTIDVANICEYYIKYFQLSKKHSELLRIAAFAHDLGYIDSPEEHEKNSINKVAPYLDKHHYSKEDISLINGMIMATRIPQKPTNLFEEILADADLDYLGRDDYDLLSNRLLHEFFHYNVVNNQKEWLDAQIVFLENHNYHTDLAKKNRNEEKFKKIEQLKNERLEFFGA